jgi:23S rRNA pseudouridine2605 synthase
MKHEPMATVSDRAVEQNADTPIRLQKFLASAGIDSRRHAEEYILAGRVTIDGEEVRDPAARVDPGRQKVRVDGELIKPQPKRYYLLNKPPGYLCTHRDPAGRPRAVDLAPQTAGTRLFTVGRLDENSRGLLLVTNDGELANRLAHPRYRVPRTYRVQVVGKVTRAMLDKLKKGLYFPEGKFRVQSIRRVRSKGQSTFLDLELTEGHNREIRRMLARIGHKVIQLERIAFGPLKLGRLPVGRCRPLRPVELKALRSLIEGKSTPRRTRKPKRSRPRH